MSEKNKFYSNGKLLLTGEYVVLDGAKALAVPTKFGQSLEFTGNSSEILSWTSFLPDGKLWAKAEFTLEKNKFISSVQADFAKRLAGILNAAKQLNPEFLKNFNGAEVETKLDFPTDWGLGSSSTLINNIANWAQVDAYNLLGNTFDGSGYDIACASSSQPITYKLKDGERQIEAVTFNPAFKDQLFFVHLNKKQNSRESINHYKKASKEKLKESIKRVSEITGFLLKAKSLVEFEYLLNNHEQVISEILDTPTIKEQIFEDYPNSIKSLGGWGGDFVLATGQKTDQDYFRNKGYSTILNYDDMVL